MNDIFDFSRFSYLLKKVIFERKMLLIGLFLLVTVYVFFVYSGGNGYTNSMMLQHFSLLVGIIFSPTILIGIILNYFSGKKSSVTFLTLPVSFFEKWLMVMVITFFIYVPLVIASIVIIDYYYVSKFRELALHELNMPLSVINQDLKYLSFDFHNQAFHLGLYIRSVFIISGLSLLGSLFFAKFSYVKFIIFVIVFFFGVITFQRFLFEIVIEKGTIGNMTDLARATIPSKVSSQPYFVQAESGIHTLVNGFMNFVFPVAIWLIALLRFKEKEI